MLLLWASLFCLLGLGIIVSILRWNSKLCAIRDQVHAMSLRLLRSRTPQLASGSTFRSLLLHVRAEARAPRRYLDFMNDSHRQSCKLQTIWFELKSNSERLCILAAPLEAHADCHFGLLVFE